MHYKHLITLFSKEYPGRIALTFLVSLATQLLTIFLPIYIARSYDLLFGIKSHRASLLSFIPEHWTATFEGYFILFMIALILRGILDYYERYLTTYLGEIHLSFLRKKIFSHQLQMSMQVYDQKGFAKYLLRYSGDLTSIQAFVSKGIIKFGSDIILLALTVWIFFVIDTYLGITLLLLSIALAGLIYLLNLHLYTISVARRNTKSGLLKFVTSRLQGLITIKVFNRFVPETNKYEKRVKKLLALGKTYQKATGAIGAIIPFGLYFTIGMVMWVTMYLKNNDSSSVDPETFFTALLLLITIMPVFRRCFRVSIIWRNGGISYQKLADILQLPVEGNSGVSSFDWKKGNIQVHNLSFKYADQKEPVFQNLNLEIPFGNITAIQGNTGIGKTTLLKLLIRLYNPTNGEIRIDGLSISDVDLKLLRRKMALVTDQCPLLGKTIFEATSYSRRKDNQEKVLNVLVALGLSDQLGLNHPIGESGNNLSNGQKKLLIYTRAFLTQKPILIIDEPFENLDDDSILKIIRYLNQIRHQRTIVLLSRKHISEYLKVDFSYILDPITDIEKKVLNI